MSVLRRAKLRTPDGTESIEYPLGVDAENVEVANRENLSQRLVRIDEDLEKNEEDIAAVSELAGTNKQNIGANEIRIDALERRSTSVNKKPYYFNTVADMKAYQELVEGDMVITLGYHEVNDGGQGLYEIVNDNTLISDDGSIHNLSNGLKAKLIVDNEINVKQFGVYGDGEHDDTRQLQNIIDNFDIIFFPNGHYLISSPIILSDNNRIIYIKGESQKTSLFSNNDIELLTFNCSSTVYIENITLRQNIINHTNRLASFINLGKFYMNKVYIRGFDETDSISNINILLKDITITTIENCVFNNSSLDIRTWDVKISKSWFWSVSQDYCISINNAGNINIDNCDFVPPFIERHSNYIETYNQNDENWNQIISQGAIIINNSSNGINITNCYIDGNPARTGRGIIINGGCFNINIINNRSNLMNDNLITISSSYQINISDNYLLNYANFAEDQVSFVAIYKKQSQTPYHISINNNMINAHSVKSSILTAVINENDCSSITSVDSNCFIGNPSKDVWLTEIKLFAYTGTIPMSHNKSSTAKGTSGHQFYTSGTFEVKAGGTGKTITFSTYPFPYDLLPQNIIIAPDNRIIPSFRLQKISNNQYYLAFSAALENDTIFYYTTHV